MVICIIAFLVLIIGFILSSRYYDMDYMIYGLVGFVLVFFVGMILDSLPVMYNINTETKELVAYNDGLFYRNDIEDKTISFCIIDNAKVSHEETVKYNDLKVEYIAGTEDAVTTIKTYQIKPKLKYILFAAMNNKNSDITLQLPESARN